MRVDAIVNLRAWTQTTLLQMDTTSVENYFNVVGKVRHGFWELCCKRGIGG